MRKARVLVWLKQDVLDPQGRTVTEALNSLGYGSVKEVRQGKAFNVTLDGSPCTDSELSVLVSDMAKKLLSNPVIEDFTVELLPED